MEKTQNLGQCCSGCSAFAESPLLSSHETVRTIYEQAHTTKHERVSRVRSCDWTTNLFQRDEFGSQRGLRISTERATLLQGLLVVVLLPVCCPGHCPGCVRMQSCTYAVKFLPPANFFSVPPTDFFGSHISQGGCDVARRTKSKAALNSRGRARLQWISRLTLSRSRNSSHMC